MYLLYTVGIHIVILLNIFLIQYEYTIYQLATFIPTKWPFEAKRLKTVLERVVIEHVVL